MTTTRLFADRRHGVDRRAALQLLAKLPFVGEPTFDAAVQRLARALELLEKRR